MTKPKPPIQRVIDSYHGQPCTYVRPSDAPHRPGEPCGEIHEHCRGHVKGSAPERRHKRGDPCGDNAVRGQLVCRRHGGSAPQNVAAADQRLARQRAEGEVGALLAEALGIIEPLSGWEQLSRAINRAGAMAEAYRILLAELPERSTWSWINTGDDGKERVAVTDDGLLGPDQHGVMRLHAYEEGLRHWTRLHGQLLKTAADIGMEERKQRFHEDQVRTIGTAIRTLVAGLGRELDDPEVVPVVEAALQAITAGAP